MEQQFFTEEQLELIKKLRGTGMKPDQVLQAFGKFEIPDNNNLTVSAAALYSPLLVQHLTSSASTSSATTPNLTIQTVPPPSPVVAVPVKTEQPTSSSTSSPPLFDHPICSSAPRPIRSQRTPMKEITTLDDPNELEEFMQQGEEACILDMKTFITQFSLRQTTVAMMTGVSQPYISKLLNGNHRELSLRCRKNIYCWYLNCRRHPAKLSAFLADPSTRLETNGDGELIPQRRERYVFRPILIRMLESFFTSTPFPDLPRRVEIATACNHVLQLDKKGVGLMPKEVVSPQVVSNWFANKRKELRRRSAEATATSSASSSSSSSSACSVSANTDSVSVSSMSPPSRDEENNSRITTPETTVSLSPSSFETTAQLPLPQTTPNTTITASSPTMVTVTPLATSTNNTITIPSPISTIPSPSPLELLAMAQRLGIQLPIFDAQFSNFPSNSFVPFPIFYSNPAILKSE